MIYPELFSPILFDVDETNTWCILTKLVSPYWIFSPSRQVLHWHPKGIRCFVNRKPGPFTFAIYLVLFIFLINVTRQPLINFDTIAIAESSWQNRVEFFWRSITILQSEISDPNVQFITFLTEISCWQANEWLTGIHSPSTNVTYR